VIADAPRPDALPGVPIHRRWVTRHWRWGLLAAAIVVLAGFLRIHRLGAQEIWLDEAFSFHMATTRGLIQTLSAENSPPLYYLLVRGWVDLAGQSESALRMISALAGTLCVAAIIWAGRELVAPAVGLWGGLVAAVAPIHIYYSQEARAYVLLTLALTVTYAALGRALKRNTWPWWTLASAGALLALYTHYFALLGLLPTAALVWASPAPGRWRRYLGALLWSGLGFLPWAVWSFLLTPRSLVPFAWIREVWEATPPRWAIPLSLEVFGLGSQIGLLPIRLKQFTMLDFPPPLRLLGLGVLAFLALWVAVPVGERTLGMPGLGRRKVALGVLVFLPLAALWLASLAKPLYVVGRYDLVAFPAFTLLLGVALWKLQRLPRAGRLLAPLAALLLLIPIGAKLFLYYRAPSGQGSRWTAHVLHTSVDNGDVVVFSGVRVLPVMYYMSRAGYRWDEGECRNELGRRRFACRLYPREVERSLLLIDQDGVPSVDAVRADIQDYLRQTGQPGGALWVVFSVSAFASGKLRLSEGELALVRELLASGYEPQPVSGAPGVFRFRKTG
jgi:uncharacterized membrane protein